MVVCVCNAIREREIRSAVRAGATCPRSAYQALGRQPKCGQCLSFARSVIDSERAAA
jgi:bacterioferritin-associated ferredoxin